MHVETTHSLLDPLCWIMYICTSNPSTFYSSFPFHFPLSFLCAMSTPALLSGTLYKREGGLFSSSWRPFHFNLRQDRLSYTHKHNGKITEKEFYWLDFLIGPVCLAKKTGKRLSISLFFTGARSLILRGDDDDSTLSWCKLFSNLLSDKSSILDIAGIHYHSVVYVTPTYIHTCPHPTIHTNQTH
jgi:hypothetical protein